MFRIQIVLLVACSLLIQASAVGQAPQPVRTWKDASGQFSIEAVFVRVQGGQVVLRRANKQELMVPLAKLSPADQQYVRKLMPPVPRQTDGRLDNNLKCVDLSDMKGQLPLDVVSSKKILVRTEPWEYSTWTVAARKDDTVGYPSMVHNDRGKNPDGKYYLYYAHHDPTSGIACAVADSIEGPYHKLKKLDPQREHSLVLVNPHFPGKIGDPPTIRALQWFGTRRRNCGSCIFITTIIFTGCGRSIRTIREVETR